MSKPLISIIIPVYNGSPHLQSCIKILEKITYENIEIIFIENNSTDDSIRLLKRFCSGKKNTKLLFCIKQGPGAARNVGLKKSSGEFIAFLDVDDEILPNKFDLQLQAFRKYPSTSMVIGQTLKRYENGRSFNPNDGNLKLGLNQSPDIGFFWLKQFQHNPHISGVLLKKNIVDRGISFPEQLFFGEDIAFFVKIGLIEDVVIIDDQVSIYNRHNLSSVSISNSNIPITERYLKFFTEFSIPYFSKKNIERWNKIGLQISKRITFKLMMKTLFVIDHDKYKSLNDFNFQNYPKHYYGYYIIFKIFPFKYANYIFEYFEKK